MMDISTLKLGDKKILLSLLDGLRTGVKKILDRHDIKQETV